MLSENVSEMGQLWYQGMFRNDKGLSLSIYLSHCGKVDTCKYTCNLQSIVLTEQLHLFPLLASKFIGTCILVVSFENF